MTKPFRYTKFKNSLSSGNSNNGWREFRCRNCEKLLFKVQESRYLNAPENSKIGVETKCPRCYFMNYTIYLT